jgi:hypothetical protein
LQPTAPPRIQRSSTMSAPRDAGLDNPAPGSCLTTGAGSQLCPRAPPARPRSSPRAYWHAGGKRGGGLVARRPGRPGAPPPAPPPFPPHPPLVRFKASARAGAGTAEYIRFFINRCNTSLGARAEPVYIELFKPLRSHVGSIRPLEPARHPNHSLGRAAGTAVPTTLTFNGIAYPAPGTP